MSFLETVNGKVQEVMIEHSKLVLTVGPIGLVLYVPQPERFGKGQEVSLSTHLVWRDDHQQLYGFIDTYERDIFLKLIKVRTLGPKIALSILSSNREHFFSACAAQDKEQLTKIPGVGPKMAIKILQEFDGQELQSMMSVADDFQDFKTALQGLGFSAVQVYNVAKEIGSELSLELKIKKALKILGEAHVR